MSNRTPLLCALLSLVVTTRAALADPATPLTGLANMPVKEATVFKDGHAFLLHAGAMPVDAGGNVVLDALPQPVLGTFWPYSADKAARLVSVTASQRKVKLDRTALNLREMIEANVGAAVVVTELPAGGAGTDAAPITYNATIESILTQTGEELEATSPPGGGEKLPLKGEVVLFRTGLGTKAVGFNRIVDVTFVKAPATKLSHEEFRNLLTLKLDWAGQPPAKEAQVGMLYLQKGVRWIPNYKVSIDGNGEAIVKLQATLINELADLDDVTANLVIGVPSFAFAATSDPIGLQQAAAQLSAHFAQPGDLGNNFSNTGFALSNAIMSQTARMGEVRQAQPAPAPGADLGPEIASQGKTEDLYLFSVKNVTLKKGQRMVLPVAEYKLKYKDVYTLDVAVTPPPEVMKSFDNGRGADVARLLAAPKVMHKVRLVNSADAPLTTAPALITRKDQVVAQGMMTYTAPGASVDLELTAAVDVNVKKTDRETARVPDAQVWNGDRYMRVDATGKIALINYGKQAIEVEVTRHVMGKITSADHDGQLATVNVLEDATYAPTGAAGQPYWWGWYNWPWWWHRFNGIDRVTWDVKLESGKGVDLNYTWHYFWR